MLLKKIEIELHGGKRMSGRRSVACPGKGKRFASTAKLMADLNAGD
jgi:hypothetical protein